MIPRTASPRPSNRCLNALRNAATSAASGAWSSTRNDSRRYVRLSTTLGTQNGPSYNSSTATYPPKGAGASSRYSPATLARGVDVTAFLKSIKKELDVRGLEVKGITTDGSSLYPGPLALRSAGVPHEACSFHVLKELTGSVPYALAKVRREPRADRPPMPSGRPSKAKARHRRRAGHAGRRVADLFEHRYWFVTHHLTPAERVALRRATRGLPDLRALRDVMDEVYRPFVDRRCRTGTALGKLARLRPRVRRFKRIGKTRQKVFAPTLEKALVFLDDKPLPSTSDAVERGNRRHRKVQKTACRVRTKRNLERRMALDLLREMNGTGRERGRRTLHRGRSPGRFSPEEQPASVTVA